MRTKCLALSCLFAFLCLGVVRGVVARSADRVRSNPTTPTGVQSLLESSVEPLSWFTCYEAAQMRELCFTVYNRSQDAEYISRTRVTFPDYPGLGAWNASCKTQDGADSSGAPVDFTCTKPAANEILYLDDDGGDGEITGGSSWSFCLDVTVPPGYIGPRMIHWGLLGDQTGATPHEVTGTIEIDPCQPLMLRPQDSQVEGCNGIQQNHEFEVFNNTTSGYQFYFTYDVPSGNAAFHGPSSVYIPAGNIISITTELTPTFFLEAGDIVTATLDVSADSQSDSATLVKHITSLAGWITASPSPSQTMDNAVVWASHADGGLWSIGGYGSNGAAQRYNPFLDTWTMHTPEISPTIEYPSDGCYGLDAQGHEVVVLFPDTVVTGTVHRYDITDDQWDAISVPVGYPANGRWAHDITSLFNINGINRCYLTGGATQSGGGNTQSMWEYLPDENITVYKGNFSLNPSGFDFHASWYVPWVGAGGAVCVGGGIDSVGTVISSTQCYDLDTQAFNTKNADLGLLPEPWWGMADGWQVYDGRYQIWLANGVTKNGGLLPASAYADQTTGGFVSGPDLPVGLYRLEGDGFDGRFFVEQGAQGMFNATNYNQVLMRCPKCWRLFLPILLRTSP